MQIAVQHQIHVKLGKETVTMTVNAQEILCVEGITVCLSLGIAYQTLIAVKKVKYCECRKPITMGYYFVCHCAFLKVFEIKTRKYIYNFRPR